MSKLNLKTLNEVIQDLVAYGTLDRQHPMTKILVRCIQTLHELPVPDYVAIGSIEIIGELVHVQTIDTDFNEPWGMYTIPLRVFEAVSIDIGLQYELAMKRIRSIDAGLAELERKYEADRQSLFNQRSSFENIRDRCNAHVRT